MKIRKIGFTTFKLAFDQVEFLTDPILSDEAGVSIRNVKNNADVVLLTGAQYMGKHDVLEDNDFTKLEPKAREKVFTICSPGEYEVGGVIVRRPQDADYYVMDEGSVRIVYFGEVSKKIELDQIKNLGDVDVLILPVGNGDVFPNYENLQKVIQKIDPTYLIPSAYKEDGLDSKYDGLKSVDEFVKQFGYTHVTNDNKFTITSGDEPDNKVIEVIVLE